MTNRNSEYEVGRYYQSVHAHPYRRIFKATEVHETHTVLVEVGSLRHAPPAVDWHADPRRYFAPLTMQTVAEEYNDISRDLDEARRKTAELERAKEELTGALEATRLTSRPEGADTPVDDRQ